MHRTVIWLVKSLIYHRTHEDKQGITYVQKLTNLANLDDKSKPNPRLAYWLWLIQQLYLHLLHNVTSKCLDAQGQHKHKLWLCLYPCHENDVVSLLHSYAMEVVCCCCICNNTSGWSQEHSLHERNWSSWLSSNLVLLNWPIPSSPFLKEGGAHLGLTWL